MKTYRSGVRESAATGSPTSFGCIGSATETYSVPPHSCEGVILRVHCQLKTALSVSVSQQMRY